MTAPTTVPRRVVNGRRGILYRRLISVPANQQRIRAQAGGLVAFDRHCQRIGGGFTTDAVDDVQYFSKRLATSVLSGQARQALRDRVQVRDAASNVGADDRITD